MWERPDETKVWLDYSKDCNYMNVETHEDLMKGYDEVRKMLISMMKNPEIFCK